jgi:hypothetical protein
MSRGLVALAGLVVAGIIAGVAAIIRGFRRSRSQQASLGVDEPQQPAPPPPSADR